MRTRVNLSSRPFTNHRLFWIALGAVALLGFGLTLSVEGQKNQLIARADQVESQVKSAEAEIERLTREIEKRRSEVKPVALKPEEAYELAAARQLIDLKSFSWNRLLSDIEGYVPDKARITSIRVSEIFGDERGLAAAVEIKAAGMSSNELPEMMTRLAASNSLFEIGKTGQDAPSEDGGVPFTIEVIYRPARGGVQ
jgi:Tfp pilus assembly protein PilN